MAKTADLAALQQLDVALDERRTARRQIELRLADTGPLHEGRVAVREHETLLRDLDSRQREADRLAGQAKEKLKAEERRLYDGTVTSPRELAAIQREVEALRRRCAERDEVLLGLMTQADDVGSRHAGAVKLLRDLEADSAAEAAALRERRAGIENEIADLEARHDELTSRISPDSLALYHSLRERRRGQAVAQIARNACGGCRIGLPGDTVSKARRGDALVQCPSCDRILVGA